jgi:hypothetical protein
MVQFEEVKKPAWIEASSEQIIHYLEERKWAERAQIIQSTDPPIIEFGKSDWPPLESVDEIWELLPKGEIYENEHGLFTKDERFIWKNYGRPE